MFSQACVKNSVHKRGGVSVQGVSVQGGLCQEGLCPGGESVQVGLFPGVSVRETPRQRPLVR